MSNPISPNYKKGVGQLATSRFDFQDHIDGNNFRHQAGQIDLFPTVVIGANTATNVQDAIAELAASIVVPFVPDATTISKGIIRLGGDLGGTGTTAASPKVSGLNGYPLSLPTTPGTNTVLTWTGSAWAAQPIVPATSVVSGTVVLGGDLAGSGSSSVTPRVGGIQGFPVASTTPTSGEALVWNGSIWTPTGVPVPPAGTGFATVTASVFDSSATANLKYAGGKLQTSVNIQYLNSGITGDLAWNPTSTNKTLTLPNATDTLVGRSTTDTLSNKTIILSTNTVTDSGGQLGDLAKSNGSQYLRFSRGTALQVLRVNAGGTDLEWATSTSGSSAGSVNQVQLADGSGGFLANNTLVLAPGGANALSIISAAVQFIAPLSGSPTVPNGFQLQMATVNAHTSSGHYNPTNTELASPYWVISGGNPADGYVNLPIDVGTIYFITNSTGNTISFIPTGSASTGAQVGAGKNAILINNGSAYITFLTT